MPPAARLTDLHVCPAFTGIVPHVGGPILPPCAPTVLTMGLPQAKVGDMCTCVGPPSSIIKGSAVVFVMGMPAARMLDNTAHGGLIMGPCALTVLIGDAPNAGGPGAMVDAAISAAIQGVEMVETVVANVEKNVGDIADAFAQGPVEGLKLVGETMKRGAETLWDAEKRGASRVWEAEKRGAQRISDAAADGAQAAADKARETAQKAADRFRGPGGGSGPSSGQGPGSGSGQGSGGQDPGGGSGYKGGGGESGGGGSTDDY